jgi:hypothetical protein
MLFPITPGFHPIWFAQCSQKFADGSINMAPLQKFKKLWVHPWSN